jgi:hypothetical protein
MRKAVTIAIGAVFDGGTAVCADTKIVATDGATSSGSKVSLSLTPKKMTYAVANAAEDGRAATMLAGEMTNAACDSDSYEVLLIKLKEVMTAWYSAYGVMKPSAPQFLLACGGKRTSNLFFCEPPNTVLRISDVIAIGQGGRPIEPIMQTLFWPIPKFGVKSALLRLAYLMYRAKAEEGSACGGNTTAVIVTKDGAFTFVKDEEMQKAEVLASKVDSFLTDTCKQLLTSEPKEAGQGMEQFVSLGKDAKELRFSLELLNKTGWVSTGWRGATKQKKLSKGR